MRREWDLDALIESWTLCEADLELIGAKRGATKLGFCLLLKYFEIEGRFPRRTADVPAAAVEFVAAQVKVDPSELTGYNWAGRLEFPAVAGRRRVRHGGCRCRAAL